MHLQKQQQNTHVAAVSVLLSYRHITPDTTLLVSSSQARTVAKLKGSRCHGGNLQTGGEGSLLSQLERNLHFPWASAVFPAQKHQTSKRHINLQSYTNSQSHASIFLIPAHKFSATKNTHIYLHQKRPREANSGF